MKLKKVALLLSISLFFSENATLLVNAEEEAMFDDGTEFLEGNEENSNFSLDDGRKIQESFEENETEQEDIVSANGDISAEQKESNTDIKVENSIFSSGKDNKNDQIAEMNDEQDVTEKDKRYNIKYFTGSIENSDIFLGENPEITLKVEYPTVESVKQLEKSNYTVMGYVTENQLEQANHNLDNLSEFKDLPDTTGKWYLILEGVNSYYGRQAVCVTVHDQYDLGLYKWSIDSEVIVGENPEGSLEIFKDNDEKHLLGNEDYIILGFITEEQYIAANYNLEEIADFAEKTENAGNWLLVVEGCGQYHGKQAAWINVKNQYDISMYQGQIAVDKIHLEEDISKYIEVSRLKYGTSQILYKDAYKIIGYIKENDFIASGYDLNRLENMQESIDSDGGWYAVIEGTEPYYGRNVIWVEVNKSDSIEK